MNSERKSETIPAGPPNRATDLQSNGASARGNHAAFRAKLRFFRTMLWVLIYAMCVVFFFALIFLGGFRLQAKVIGGVLIACMVLVIATYVLQWLD